MQLIAVRGNKARLIVDKITPTKKRILKARHNYFYKINDPLKFVMKLNRYGASKPEQILRVSVHSATPKIAQLIKKELQLTSSEYLDYDLQTGILVQKFLNHKNKHIRQETQTSILLEIIHRSINYDKYEVYSAFRDTVTNEDALKAIGLERIWK